MSEKKYLPNSNTCFVCGEDNAAGLQTRFYVEDGYVKMALSAAHHHCGYHNVLHGGVIAAAMDECMGWAAARAIHRMCVTGDLTVRYLKRAPVDAQLTVCAEVVRAHRRLVHTAGVLVDQEGVKYARSEGRFLPLTVEETLTVDDGMLYRGDEERVFDELRVSAESPQE